LDTCRCPQKMDLRASLNKRRRRTKDSRPYRSEKILRPRKFRRRMPCCSPRGTRQVPRRTAHTRHCRRFATRNRSRNWSDLRSCCRSCPRSHWGYSRWGTSPDPLRNRYTISRRRSHRHIPRFPCSNRRGKYLRPLLARYRRSRHRLCNLCCNSATFPNKTECTFRRRTRPACSSPLDTTRRFPATVPDRTRRHSGSPMGNS